MNFDGLPRNHFAAILADPPWRFKTWNKATAIKRRASGANVSSAVHYSTMPFEEIAALPVRAVAADNCCLFMWVSWPMIEDALSLIRVWGFCVAVGTRVLGDDLMWVPAEKLEPGHRLLCFDDNLVGGRRYYRWGHVVSTGVEPLPCQKVILANGKELTATVGHRWLVHDGAIYRWATASELAGNHNGRRTRGWKMPILAPTQTMERSYEGGFLAAAFDSEGHLRKAKCGLGFSQKQNALMDAVQTMLSERKFSFEEYSYEHQNCDQIIIGNRMDTMRFLMQFRPPRLLANWLANNPPYSLYNLPCIDIDRVEDAGIVEVVTLQTDVGTYIAEGFGAHNTYKTCAFDWMKAHTGQIDMFRDDADALMGMGYWTRANTEPCLLATRGKPKRRSAAVRMGIIEPRREHSRKPDCVYSRIERLVDGPRLELFARAERPGWTSWGNEVGKFQQAAE